MKLVLMSAFQQLSQDGLAMYAKNVGTLMTNNGQFASLKTQVAELVNRTVAYTDALAESINGGRLTTIVKNKCKEALLKQVSEVAVLVELLADGNESVVLAAGLDVRKTYAVVTSLNAPNVLKVTNVSAAGVVTAQLAKVEGATNYGIEKRIVDADIDTVWKNGDYSSSLKMKLEGFESGKTYQLRFRAIGNKGMVSDWSAVQELLVS